MRLILTIARRVRHSIAASGFWRTMADAFLVVAHRPLSGDQEHKRFDRRFGTDTAGRIDPQELRIEDAAAREAARVYLASPPGVTRWGLLNAGVDPRQFTFVDIGCGKGRVLLVASELPFRAVHGVDISGDLCAIARKNLEIYPRRVCRDVHVHHQDAMSFTFPPGDLLVHFYHSFAVELFVELLQRLDPSSRRVVIAYLLYQSDVASVKTELARIPWLTLAREEQSVTGQYEWLFYRN